ncbi:hypothetical protein Tco_0139748 [Tanacetum coccineum]
MANDDPILTTMRFIPQHEVVQRYGAILPDYLTNPAMKESEALSPDEVPMAFPHVKESKASTKVAKSGKEKSNRSWIGNTLSEIALTEAEQM